MFLFIIFSLGLVVSLVAASIFHILPAAINFHVLLSTN